MADKGVIHETNLGTLKVHKVVETLEDLTQQSKMIYGVKSDCCYISEIFELECAKNTLIIALIVVVDKWKTKVPYMRQIQERCLKWQYEHLKVRSRNILQHSEISI